MFSVSWIVYRQMILEITWNLADEVITKSTTSHAYSKAQTKLLGSKSSFHQLDGHNSHQTQPKFHLEIGETIWIVFILNTENDSNHNQFVSPPFAPHFWSNLLHWSDLKIENT